MLLVRLLYLSRVAPGVGPDDIEGILQAAQRNNLRHHITGVLAFNGEFFLQALEGGRSQVNRLYQHILQDSRHEQPLLLQFGEVHQRLFSDWSMAYVPANRLTGQLLMRYGPTPEFSPDQCLAESSLALLVALCDTLAA